MREAAIRIQCWNRMTFAQATLLELRRNDRATKIQTYWRMIVSKFAFKEKKNAAIKIQACARGARQRPLYRQALAEAIEEAKLENQLKTLQRKLEEAEARRIEAEKRAEEGATKTVVVYKNAENGEGAAEQASEVPPRSTGGHLSQQQQTLMDESG